MIGTIIIYSFLLLFIKIRVKDHISRILILLYTSYWCGSLVLCYINPFDYYTVSSSTYTLLIEHLIAFVMGYALVKSPKIQYNEKRVLDFDVLKLVNNRPFQILYIICLIFVLTLFVRQRALLALYSLEDVRGDFMELILENNGRAYLFYSIILTGMYHFCLALMSYMLFFYRKWIYILPLFIYVLLFSIIGGGRNQFMIVGYYILGLLILSNHIYSKRLGFATKYVIPPRIRILSLIILILMIISMSIMTSFRSGNKEVSQGAIAEGLANTGNIVGEYSAGPIVAFDIALDNPFITGNHRFYGTATISGTDYILYLILYRFGLYQAPTYNMTTSILQNEYIHIGSDRGWNYAYTSCMYYYYDFGILGVIFMPFLLGYIMRKLILRLYTRLDIYTIAMFQFMSICLYMSVFSGYLHKMVTIIYLVFLYLLSTRVQRKSI